MLRSLFKKSLYYFATLVGGKLLTAGFFIILARVLLPDKFGEITYFVTVVQVISVLADFGLKNWYQKQMAIKPSARLFAGLLSWRWWFFGASAGLAWLGQMIFAWAPPGLLPWVIVALLLEGLVSVADGYYLVQQQSIRLGYKLIARNLLLFLSLFFIHGPQDWQVFFLAYNVALALVLVFYFPYQALGQRWWKQDKKLPSIKNSLPYGAIDDLGIIYGRADSLLVEKLQNVTNLGIYGAAYRYLDAFNLLPQALFHNLFPIAAKKNGISSRQVIKMIAVMTTLGMLAGAAMFVLSDFLTITLLGESYAGAAELVRWFAVVVVVFFFNAPANTIIQSHAVVKKYLPYLALIVGLNIILNLVLIPNWGVRGAAGAKLICELALVGVNLYLLRKIYGAPR